MDLKRGYVPESGRIRTLHPFDIEELGMLRDPKFLIRVKEENLTDVARRWDALGFKPNSDKTSQVKSMHVGMTSIIETIDSWENLSAGTEPVECNKEGKRRFAETQFFCGKDGEGASVWKTAWGLTLEALDRQKIEELGNAPSSSDTTSASASNQANVA